MVQVTKGLLVKCSDSAIKEFLKYLDEKQVLGRRFILHDLDDVHLFVAEDVAKPLQTQLDELMMRNSYTDTMET